MTSALGPFRVVDLSTHIAGPFCTRWLADYGAEVVKVEPPQGDPARGIGPFFQDDPHPEKSLLYFYLNCNKRGVTINLETASGRNLLRELLKGADVLVESFRPGYLAELGLSYAHLQEDYPRLVMASITPFGQTGPYRDYAGNDLIYYAMSGMMYTSGAHDREPLKHGHPQSYYMAGITAAYTVAAALFAREMNGRGQHIDLSIQETVAAHEYGSAIRYVYTGTIGRRAPQVESGSFKGVKFEGIVPAQDGFIAPSLQKGRPRAPFREFAELIGRPDLDDTQFANQELIQQNGPEMDEVLLPILKGWKKFDYFNTAMAHGFVAGVVQTPEDLVNCPQLQARGFYTEVEHPVIGTIKMPGEMFRLPACPWRLRLPAPLLGQHNHEVYHGELGYAIQDLIQLRQLGAI
jgi:CoA:oxalate CoA-transferase